MLRICEKFLAKCAYESTPHPPPNGHSSILLFLMQATGCHGCLVFAFGQLEKLTFSYKLKYRVPRISWLETFGLLVIFLGPQQALSVGSTGFYTLHVY